MKNVFRTYSDIIATQRTSNHPRTTYTTSYFEGKVQSCTYFTVLESFIWGSRTDLYFRRKLFLLSESIEKSRCDMKNPFAV